MRPNWIAALACSALFLLAETTIGFARAQDAKLQPHDTRSSPLDLEVAGDLGGVQRGTTRYVTREELLSMSQAVTVSPDDGNFKSPSQVKGVPIEDLMRALGAPAIDTAIAICKDKYRGHYPRAYVTARHPVLVLELNGKPLSDSSKEGEGDDPGPYLIAHANFKSVHAMRPYQDEPQIPWGVVRLEFRDEKEVFGAIAPHGPHTRDAGVQDGFIIAQQNCFRCHNNGAEGGLKSGVTWTVLAAMAAGSPQFFTEYVRDPKSKNPMTRMAASAEYDDATMRSLVAYFQTFSPQEKP